jgi:predicted outer membrane protein
MRRGWIWTVATLAAAVAMLDACRAEEWNDRAQGKGKYPRGVEEQTAAQATDKSPLTPDTEGRRAVERMLGMILIESQAEIEAARLAEERAATPAVKAFAATMRRDHEEMLGSLNDLAKSRGMDLNTLIGADPMLSAQRAASIERGDRLRTLSGPAFDGTYMSAQPMMHLLLAKMADQGRQAAVHKDISGFFTHLAGSLRAHRDMALSAMPLACGGTAEALGEKAPPGHEPHP